VARAKNSLSEVALDHFIAVLPENWRGNVVVGQPLKLETRARPIACVLAGRFADFRIVLSFVFLVRSC
jgi:hypothetical protein